MLCPSSTSSPKISTHALTWSATKAMGMCVDCGKISTHALTWSATRCCVPVARPRPKFQLTRSRGARRALLVADFPDPCNFNSRAHVERDRGSSHPRARAENFNSRAHVERDKPFYTIEVVQHNFNSRAHVERDRDKTLKHKTKKISTHALTWSAT